MRFVFPAFLLLLAAWPGAAARAEEEPSRVGVYPLERLGAADAAYAKLQDDLRRHLGLFPMTEAFDIATPSHCRADDLTCLVAVGRLAAADLVVHGSVERFSDGYAVRLQLIDVGRTTRREVKRIIQGGGPELAAAMERAACELMTTDACEGTLVVSGVPGARVLVGAKDLGATPFRSAIPIGRHLVRIARGGLSTEDRFVNVSYRQEALLDVEERAGMLAFMGDDFDGAMLIPALEAEDPPPQVATRDDAKPGLGSAVFTAAPAPIEPESMGVSWMPTAFYASTGVGGAGLATGLVFGVLSQLKATQANDKFDQRALVAGDQSLHASSRSRATIANVSFGVGALGLVAAAVFYLLDPGESGSGADTQVPLTLDGAIVGGSL